MCVYNTPIEFLKEATNSILDQTYKNLEFVIVDDASDSSEVVNYLEDISQVDKRIVLLRNKLNLGLTKSLNVGLERCNGIYIARMDSDDISLPDRIQKQVEYMELHPEVALVGSNIISFGEGIQEIDSSTMEDRYGDPEIYRISALFENPGPAHPSFMFRSSFLMDNNIKYREDIKKAQDYGIITDILKVGGIINKIKAPLVKYRVHGGQITSMNEIEQMGYRCRVSYDYIRYLFPELDVEEGVAIMLMGVSYDLEFFLRTSSNNAFLKQTCRFIYDYIDILDDVSIYINGVNDVIGINQERHYYNPIFFNRELKHKLWKKCIRMSKEKHKLWGINRYTIFCYLYTTFVNETTIRIFYSRRIHRDA